MKRRIIRFAVAVLAVTAIVSSIVWTILDVLHSGRTQENVDVEYSFEGMAPVADRHILYISSYAPSYITYSYQEEGFKRVLYDNYIDYEVAFMDTKNYDSDEHLKLFHDKLKYEIEHHGAFDGVLLGDDAALAFADAYGDELFPNVPVAFFGVNDIDFAHEMHEKHPRITGYTEDMYLQNTLDIAMHLLPEADKVVAIYDNSLPGIGERKVFYELSAQYPGMDFTGYNFSEGDLEDFKEWLGQISDKEIVLYMTAFEDQNKNYHPVQQVVRLIDEYAAGPVFRNDFSGVGDGIVGGEVLDWNASAGGAARILVDAIRNGRDTADVPVASSPEGKVIFDAGKMREFGLSRAKLPEGTLLLHEKENYFTRNWKVILPACHIVAGMLILMVLFWINYKREKKTSDELSETTRQLSESESVLRYNVTHDALTGLVNRQSAVPLGEDVLRDSEQFCVCMADVDNFKEINDSYGHQNGDRVLIRIAARLQEKAKDYGWFTVRYGGDEFLVIQPSHAGIDGSSEQEALFAVFREPVQIGSDQVVPTFSFGFVNGSRGESLPQKIVDADLALNEAKKACKNTRFWYNASLRGSIEEQNALRNKVIHAVQNDGFYMVYQPQVNLDGDTIHGYEALIRMKGDDVSPGAFIPVAERTGWIGVIGRIVTRKVIEQIAEWKAEGRELHPVSINYSTAQMRDEGYISYLRQLLQKHDVDPSLLEIEITESMFMNNTKEVLSLLDEIRRMGIRLLIDDFGSGYSSFGYLTYLPVDIVKIDKSLADAYLADGKESMIGDIIRLSHNLGKYVIQEGAETQEQVERLRALGCDCIQGYYFSRPRTADEAISYAP